MSSKRSRTQVETLTQEPLSVRSGRFIGNFKHEQSQNISPATSRKTMVPDEAAGNDMMDEPVIGIDLGTTNSCVGIVRHGRPEIIANSQGDRVTPSCVAFAEEERLFGKPAKEQLLRNPENTIYEVKRLMGKKYDDPEVQKNLKYWPFKVIKVEDELQPCIEVEFLGESKHFYPKALSGLVLEHMKEIVEEQYSMEIKKAVVTVPAYFDQNQRLATVEAATIAGFKDCEIINEPTAAAFAYRLNEEDKEKNILVYDLGGGTFDVSIVHTKQGHIRVRAIDGSTTLGGSDIDSELINYALQTIEDKHKKDLKDDKKAKARLKVACEKAKIALSVLKRTYIELEYDKESYSLLITRATFEDKCNKYFDETFTIMKRCLSDANIDKEDIQEIVLVGGSTRIPRVKEMLHDYFGRNKLIRSIINPEEAVAQGAALYAVSKFSNVEQKADKVILHDVIPLSLGTQLRSGLMDILIMRNTSTPHKKSKRYITTEDYQEVILVDVYEGEREQVKDNIFLGEFSIDIPPLPIGECVVLVTFQVDTNGILKVTAKDEKTGKEKYITIKEDKKGRLNQEEIDKMIEDARAYREYDAAVKARIGARNELERYALRTMSKIRQQGYIDEEKKRIITRCEQTLNWLAENQNASIIRCNSKLRSLQEVCQFVHDQSSESI